MYEVKKKIESVEWSGSIVEVTKNATFPLLVKPTKETAKQYNISEDPILLDQFWIVQRIVAHSLEEEGAYVVGPQVDIPSDYDGTFKYLPDQKGNKILDQTFTTMRDIASVMPQRVFCLKRAITYPVISNDGPPADDKIKSVVLQPGEQLNILDRTEIFTTSSANRFLFIGKSKVKLSTVQCVSVMVESTKEVINLPLSTRGSFATLVNAPVKDQLYNFRSILTGLDLPINLTTTRNCPKTLVDESFLQPGMQLRFSAIEEHEVIIGITMNEKFVEFASEGVEFFLPVHLDKPSQNKEHEIAYQTALQRFILECQMKDSLINVKDYQRSIKKHISRNVRPTKPTPLHMVAALRQSKYIPKISTTNELTAIACFSSVDHTPASRRSSMPSNFGNRVDAPLPPLPNEPHQYTPPLPPRKGRSLRNKDTHMNYPTRPPPSPPIDGGDSTSRPPPLPPSSRATPFNDLPHSCIDDWPISKVPSPPHHPPPNLNIFDGNQEVGTTHEMMSPFADSFVSDQEDENDIFGTVGSFAVRRQDQNSGLKDEMLFHSNKKNSPISQNVTLKDEPEEQSHGEETTSPGTSKEIPQPRTRSPSPQFSLSSSYDNPAFTSSPTQLATTTENRVRFGSSSSQESPTFHCVVKVTDASQNSQTSPWGESNEKLRISDTEKSEGIVLPESRNNLNDTLDENFPTSNDNRSQTIRVYENFNPIIPAPVTSPVELATTQGKKLQSLNEDFETQQQFKARDKKPIHYENVVLPFTPSDTDDRKSDVTELKLPINCDSENSVSNSIDTKLSDSNNNEIVTQSMLLPDMPAFVLKDTSQSSAIISRTYSSSSDSDAASTKSSFIESDLCSHKNESVLDANEEKSEDDRGFWISQFSFSNDGRQQVSFACNYAKPPENWTPPNDLSSLSVSEVSNSLRFIGMNEETVEWFSAEKVDGQLLCALNGNELSEHFHLSPFQLKKLDMFLKGWRPNES